MSIETVRAKILAAIKASAYGYIQISGGTLHRYDLFHALRNELKKYAPNGYITKKQLGYFFVPKAARYNQGHAFWQSNDAHIVVNQMEDALATFAPEGYYFGSHVGDGAAIGWWPDTENETESENKTENETKI